MFIFSQLLYEFKNFLGILILGILILGILILGILDFRNFRF